MAHYPHLLYNFRQQDYSITGEDFTHPYIKESKNQKFPQVHESFYKVTQKFLFFKKLDEKILLVASQIHVLRSIYKNLNTLDRYYDFVYNYKGKVG